MVEMKKKIVIFSLVFVFLLLNIPSVLAYKLIILDTPASYELYDKDKSILTHSTGKGIFAYNDITNKKWTLEIIDVNGENEATVLIAYTYYYGASMTSTLSYLDDDEITLAVTYKTASGSVTYFALYRVNINSYTYSQVGSQIEISAGATGGFCVAISRAIRYEDNDYYIVRIYTTSTTAYCYIHLFKHTITGNTLAKLWSKTTGETGAGASYDNPPLYVIQNEQSENEVYFVTTDGDDHMKPTYYMLDLDGTVSDCIKLANHPQTDRIDSVITNPQQFYCGGGLYTSGDYIYLYFTWLRPSLYYESYRKIMVVQHRLVFNETIDDETLIAQNERFMQIYPNLLTSPTYNCWTIGFLQVKDEITVYYPYLDDTEYYIMKEVWGLDDWLDYTENNWSLLDDEYETEEIPPQKSVIDYIAKEEISQFQVNCQYTGAQIWVYSGLAAMVQNWDITLTYSPIEVPLRTMTNYKFSLQTILNTYPTKCTVMGYFDNVQIFSAQTNAIGQHSFYQLTSTTGYHVIQIKIYYDNVYRYNESYEYVYISGVEDIPSAGVLLPITIGAVLSYFPIFVIYGTLIFGFSEVAGFSGVILGIALATIICAIAGLIPIYAIYIMILAFVIAVVYYIRSGQN